MYYYWIFKKIFNFFPFCFYFFFLHIYIFLMMEIFPGVFLPQRENNREHEKAFSLSLL